CDGERGAPCGAATAGRARNGRCERKDADHRDGGAEDADDEVVDDEAVGRDVLGVVAELGLVVGLVGQGAGEEERAVEREGLGARGGSMCRSSRAVRGVRSIARALWLGGCWWFP